MDKVVLWALVVICTVHIDGQQSTTAKITDVPSEDFVDRGQDGSYRFGYKNNDRGEHYHSSAASADNTVSGRYGYRDPATKRITQTTYTAGSRGFRANGANIARKMDLTQTRIPYQPPVPPNSPAYQPAYDRYYDPNEDPSYDFKFKTPTYSRGESSDSKGAVSGSFSYVDDVGKRHDVRYEADSRNGFNVKSPYPDSDPFSGVFYRGPNKPGTPPRGHTAVVRSNDGSYSFTASGPDQQRTEVSDSAGRVRGSYTYIDDKGVQRSVQYVAGPNIGYKVIRKGAGPVYSSVYPYARPEFIGSTLNDVNLPDVDAPLKDRSTLSPDLDVEQNLPNLEDDVNEDIPKLNPARTQTFDFPNNQNLNNPNYKTPSRRPTYDPFKPSDEDGKNQRDFLPPGAASYLTPYEGKNNRPPQSSAFPEDDPATLKISGEPALPNDSTFQKFPDEETFKKFPNYNENSADKKDFRKPFSTTGGRSHGNSPPGGYDYPKPNRNQFVDNGKGYSRHVNQNDYSEIYEEDYPYPNIPTGSAVRAHVQSLDILPYGMKIPSPEEAMTEHENE